MLCPWGHRRTGGQTDLPSAPSFPRGGGPVCLLRCVSTRHSTGGVRTPLCRGRNRWGASWRPAPRTWTLNFTHEGHPRLVGVPSVPGSALGSPGPVLGCSPVSLTWGRRPPSDPLSLRRKPPDSSSDTSPTPSPVVPAPGATALGGWPLSPGGKMSQLSWTAETRHQPGEASQPKGPSSLLSSSPTGFAHSVCVWGGTEDLQCPPPCSLPSGPVWAPLL